MNNLEQVIKSFYTELKTGKGIVSLIRKAVYTNDGDNVVATISVEVDKTDKESGLSARATINVQSIASTRTLVELDLAKQIKKFANKANIYSLSFEDSYNPSDLYYRKESYGTLKIQGKQFFMGHRVVFVQKGYTDEMNNFSLYIGNSLRTSSDVEVEDYLISTTKSIVKELLNRTEVVFEKDLTPEQQEAVLASSKFKTWLEKIEVEFDVAQVTVTDVDFFGSKVGFVKCRASVKDFEGNKLPGIAFIRGDAVSVLFVITEKETGAKHIALVGQARVPVAQALVYESPAGMMDEDENIAGVAIKELNEELGINELDHEKLNFLTEGFTSPGGQDEKITLYSYEHTMTTAELEEINGKQTGEENSREVIKVKIIPFEDFLSYNSTIVGQLGYFNFKEKMRNIKNIKIELEDINQLNK